MTAWFRAAAAQVLFAKEELHASGYVLGLLTTATGIANTIMWWVQPWMIKRLGARLTLCVAMASTVLLLSSD